MAHIPGSNGISQIGYVVPDLQTALSTFKENLGVREFAVVEDMPMTECTYRGQPTQFRQHMAFGFLGKVQIELIQPLSGDSTYTEFLAAHPAGGVQHLGFIVEDFALAVADFTARDFAVVQSARAGDIRVAYFDTRAGIGTWSEVIWLGEAARQRFAPPTD